MHGGGNPIPISSYGGLVTLADPTSVPEGASPRTYDTDFLVGQVKTRAGLRSVFLTANATLGPNSPAAASSASWLTPNNILVGDGVYTSFGPVSDPNSLVITEFAFSVPSLVVVSGVEVQLTGFANAPADVMVQLTLNGVPVGSPKTVHLTTSIFTVPAGSFTDKWGLGLDFSIVNSVSFGVILTAVSSGFPLATVFLDHATITLGLNVGAQNYNYIGTFTQQDGTIKNIAVDAGGDLYVEDVTNAPGSLTLVRTDITPDPMVTSQVGPDVDYLTFSDGFSGSDLPLQYTKDWIDRITQVGPGAAPTFTPAQATSNTFAISTITQNPPNSDITDPGHISVLLQSTGPGSTSPGNVITVYYSPSFYGGSPHPEAEDSVLVNMFHSGLPVYVYISGTTLTAANGNFLVTSVGNALPPGVDHFRYYFTVQTTTSAYEKIVEDTGQYQMSVATLTTSVPVPGLKVGNNVTISGDSVPAWNATWPISNALNSAAMVITNTSVTASVATYNYSVSTGTPPATGELVTVTGTTNANGALNVTNATIVTASGGPTGTFTVSVPVTTAPSVPESGSATTAGTMFQFDPGLPLLGTTTDPIYGNGTGGTLVFVAATAQLIAPGTRQGTVFFITRNGYYTAPAPPVTFTCPENTTAVLASLIPVGPPNVIARGIAITDAGQNGTPGGNFFTIPQPVSYVVNNVSYTSSSFIINDNISTTATLTFTDNILLNSLAIDVYGYNLFNQIEIGNPGWVVSYNSRNFYGLCQNKIQRFLNLSFDGGYLPVQQDGQITPLGWSQPDIYGDLVVSPKFGNAYYIKNTSAGSLAHAGSISQPAYQNYLGNPIIEPNTAYSVRVTARIPSGQTVGNLVISLTAGGVNYGQYLLPFSSMTTDTAIYIGPLLTAKFATVPPLLMLNMEASELGAGADVEIDRIEIYPTAIPILTTTVYGSYAGLPEQVDAITGQVGVSSENQQPVNGAVVMYDTLYFLKGSLDGSSMYSLQASANLEPAQWDEPEVAQKAGSIGILAYDFGEQWIVEANRNGVYLFEGGQPGKITQEIYQIWESINWPYGHKIWVHNDVRRRRLFIGIPMATPNFWLPNAPSNVDPTSPNVILMCNYQGLDSGQMLKNEPQVHTTMFGTLNSIDMRRKWSLWQIPSPYMATVEDKLDGVTDERIYICSGKGNSEIYALDESKETDDGVIIDSLYTTAGLVENTKRAQTPMSGPGRMRFGYMSARIETLGTVNMTLYPNILLGPGQSTANYYAWTMPGGFSPGDPALQDVEASLNGTGYRTFFEFRENDGHAFNLSNVTLMAKADVWNKWRGSK